MKDIVLENQGMSFSNECSESKFKKNDIKYPLLAQKT